MVAKSEKIKAGAFLFLVFCMVGLITFVPEFKNSMISIFQTLREMGLLGTVIFIALYGTCVIVTIPITMVNVALGFLYPFMLAWTISICGVLIGLIGSYFMGKTILRNYCLGVLSSHSTLKYLSTCIQKNQWKYTVLVWLISSPMFLKNYGLASLKVDFLPYITVSGTNCILMNAFHIFLGSRTKSIMSALSKGDFGNWELIAAGGTLLVSMISFSTLSYLVHRNLRDIKKNDQLNIQ